MRGSRLLGIVVASTLIGTVGAKASEPSGGSPERLILGGVLDFSAGYRDIASTDDGTGRSWEWSAAGRFNIPLSNNLSVQLDGASEFYTSLNDSEDPRRTATAGVHLSYRVPTRGLIGIFAAHGWSPLEDGQKYTARMYGVEGQLYRGDWTFYAQAGVADVTKGDTGEGINDARFARGVARYFFDANTKLELELSHARASPYIDGDDKGKFWGWGASFERKLFDLHRHPVYWSLAYRGASYDATTESDILNEHVFRVGLKVLFGARDLQHNDRYGATLDLPMLPFRANGFSELID